MKRAKGGDETCAQIYINKKQVSRTFCIAARGSPLSGSNILQA
jgi:hypothetical protein